MRTRRLPRRLIALAVAGGVAAGAAAATPRLAAGRHLAAGREALDRGDAAAAVASFREAEGWRPGDAEIQRWLARAHRRAGEFDLAFERLGRAKKAGLEPEAVEFERRLTLARSGRVAEVAGHLPRMLENATAEDGSEICEAFVTGYCLNLLFDEAEALVDPWQRDYPDSAEPFVARGEIASARERWPAAAAAFGQALKRDPSRYDAWTGLALAQANSHDRAGAERSYREAIRLRPEAAEPWQGLATVLGEAGRPDEAADALRRAVELDPLDDEPRTRLGRLALESGDPDEAARWLEPVLDRWPDDSRANFLLAKALRALGRDGEAERHFELAATGQKEIDRLHRLIQELERRPQDLDLRFEIGRIVLRCESRKQGFSWIKSVLLRDPGHRAANEELAEYYARRGEKDLARLHGRLALGRG